MRIRDDAFLNAQTPSPELQYSGQDFERLLVGAGDPLRRHAALVPGADEQRAWAVGDTAEYLTPDGVRRTGELCRPQGHDEWLVQTDEHTFNVVPTQHLRVAAKASRATHRDAIRQAMARAEAWHETRDAMKLNDTDFSVTLDYGANRHEPADADLQAYIHQRYAARILDAEVIVPGKMTLLCTTAKQAQSEPMPSDPTSTDQPGLEAEEMEGTGRIGYLVESCRRIASANPQFDLVMGPLVDEGARASAQFELRGTDGSKLYLSRAGTVTPVLAEDVAPAAGFLDYDGIALRGGLYGVDGHVDFGSYNVKAAGVEAPYSAGTGPQNIRENAPDGQYVVRADAPVDPVTLMTKSDVARERERYNTDTTTDEEKAKRRRQENQQQQEPVQPWMTAASEPDGEVREEIAGPGTVVAVDSKAKKYWKKYYPNGYGDKLVDDVSVAVTAAFKENQKRAPSEYELISTLAVLHSLRTASSTLRKQALDSKAVPMRDFVNGLMTEALKNKTVKRQLDALVVKFISKKPDRLSKLDPTIYPRLLYGMMQVDPHALRKMRLLFDSNIDPEEHLNFGDATDFNEPEAPSAEDKEKAFLEALQDAGYDPKKLAPAALESLRQQYFAQEPASKPEPDPEPEPAPVNTEHADDDLRTPLQRMTDSVRDRVNPSKKVDRAVERIGSRQPALADMYAQMAPRIERLVSSGGASGYLCATVVWNPEGCATLSSGSVRQALLTFIKGEASKKEYRDLGWIGRPRFKTFDPDVGMAEIWFRSSEARAAPQVIVEGDGEAYAPNR